MFSQSNVAPQICIGLGYIPSDSMAKGDGRPRLCNVVVGEPHDVSEPMTSHLSVLQTSAPYHLLLYSYVFGTTAYQSFFAGPVAFRALSAQSFSTLQQRVFPRYYLMQSIGTFILLVIPHSFTFDAWHWTTLGITLVGSVANLLFLGPKTNAVLRRRHAQEELEGKSAKDPTASDEMKALNRQFGRWHGISALTNLTTFLSLTLYGVLLSEGLTMSPVVGQP